MKPRHLLPQYPVLLVMVSKFVSPPLISISQIIKALLWSQWHFIDLNQLRICPPVFSYLNFRPMSLVGSKTFYILHHALFILVCSAHHVISIYSKLLHSKLSHHFVHLRKQLLKWVYRIKNWPHLWNVAKIHLKCLKDWKS